MLELIVVVLVLMWLGGMAAAYTAGGLVHLLLVLAIAAVLIRIIRGQSL